MSYSDEELERQSSEIRSKLAWVLIPVFAMCAGYFIYENNSITATHKIYLKGKNKAFSGIITTKREDGDYPRANRYIILDSGRKVGVSNEIFSKAKAGDSVIKSKGEDTTYFYLQNGETLIQDCCKYSREKYFKLLRSDRDSR